MNTIKSEKSIVDHHGVHFGAKVVRGAYLEKERKLAKLGAYPDPVNDSYEATGQMYNEVIDFLMDEATKEGSSIKSCHVIKRRLQFWRCYVKSS